MLEYKFSKKAQEIARKNEPVVKSAICTIANAYLGNLAAPIKGIGKAEGGVLVNGREIAIKVGYVIDDWRSRMAEGHTNEEEVVVMAIVDVEEILLQDGIDGLTTKYTACHYGDPLVCLLGSFG